MAVLQYRTLSNRTVATLSVERDTVFWDRELTGFGVRVYPSGGKVFVAQARGPDGPDKPNKPRRITVRPPPGAQRRAGAPADRAHHRAGQGRGGPGSPSAPGEVRRRPDGGRPGQPLSRRACRRRLQAADAADGPQRRQPPHRAGARQTADRRSGAPTRHGTPREPVRDPRNGEYDGQDADAHVCPCQGLGHGARGLPSVPVHPDEPQAETGAVPDRRGVHPASGTCSTKSLAMAAGYPPARLR